MAEVQNEWIEIYDDLNRLVKGLSEGELVFADDFTLKDSLQVLELMSPKMDPGMTVRNIDNEDISIAKLYTISESQIETLMVNMLSMEYKWLSGQSPFETILSFVYFDKALFNQISESTSHYACFKSYLKSSVQSFKLLNHIVYSSEVYAEEDFFPFPFAVSNRLIAVSIEDEDIVSSINEYKSAANEVENNNLKLFLNYRINMLETLFQMRRGNETSFKEAGFSLQKLKACLSDLQDYLISSSFETGIDDAYFNFSLFPEYMGPKPPTQSTNFNISEVFSFYVKLCSDFTKSLDIFQCKTLKEIYIFLNHFGRLNANIIVRSSIAPLLYCEGNKLLQSLEYEKIISEDILKFNLNQDIFQSAAYKEGIQVFIRKLYDIYRCFLYNKSRIHRNLLNLIQSLKESNVALWYVDKLIHIKQLEEYKIKYSLNTEDLKVFEFTDSLCTWAMQWTLRSVQTYLLLGFELDLYSTNEISTICWILILVVKAIQLGRTKVLNATLANLANKIKVLTIAYKKEKTKHRHKIKKKLKEMKHKESELKLKQKPKMETDSKDQNLLYEDEIVSLTCTSFHQLFMLVNDKRFEINRNKFETRFKKLKYVLHELPTFETISQALSPGAASNLRQQSILSMENNLKLTKIACQSLLRGSSCDVSKNYYQALLKLSLNNYIMFIKLKKDIETNKGIITVTTNRDSILPLLTE